MINCFMYNFDFQPGWIGNRESCGESQMDGEKETCDIWGGLCGMLWKE